MRRSLRGTQLHDQQYEAGMLTVLATAAGTLKIWSDV
jgi:hypothetical protein